MSVERLLAPVSSLFADVRGGLVLAAQVDAEEVQDASKEPLGHLVDSSKGHREDTVRERVTLKELEQRNEGWEQVGDDEADKVHSECQSWLGGSQLTRRGTQAAECGGEAGAGAWQPW